MKAFQIKAMALGVIMIMGGYEAVLSAEEAAPLPPQKQIAVSEKIQNFWKWFVQNKARFADFEKNRETLTPELVRQLNRFSENLVIEIEPPRNGVQSMFISADGIERYFPQVQSLVAAAPSLPGWRIVAFRQPGNLVGAKLVYPGITLETAKMWIRPMESQAGFDLVVYFPDYTDEKRNLFINATYVLLDDAIGEYFVVKGIRKLSFQRLPSADDRKGIIPFVDLPTIFAEYQKKYHR